MSKLVDPDVVAIAVDPIAPTDVVAVPSNTVAPILEPISCTDAVAVVVDVSTSGTSVSVLTVGRSGLGSVRFAATSTGFFISGVGVHLGGFTIGGASLVLELSESSFVESVVVICEGLFTFCATNSRYH